MKKFFTLVAMAFMAVGANAQAVIAEIDWTQESAYYEGVWYADGATVSVENGTGLIIETAGGENPWEPQVPIIAHLPDIEEGTSYQVKFQFESPVDGDLRLDFCSWDGSSATLAATMDVVAGANDLTVDFDDYPTPCTDAWIFYQCGHLPGKHIIKKVTVINKDGGEPGPGGDGVIAEIDWTQESAYYEGVWYADGATVSVEQGTGLIIETAGGENPWEPQVPIIAHLPDIEEGTSYQVKFQFESPVDGDLRLDFCSWDGSSATLAATMDVVAGANDLTVDFDDYPTPCTDAWIFYQCGHLPGKHIIKKVTVINKDQTGIKSVKNNAVNNGVRYNLAGQKVDASYKGIVIMNGKKFIQK